MSKIRTEARANATEYLVAAAGFDPSMPMTQVTELAGPLEPPAPAEKRPDAAERVRWKERLETDWR